MDDIKKNPFEEYIRQSEPSKRELGYAWYTAMSVILKLNRKTVSERIKK